MMKIYFSNVRQRDLKKERRNRSLLSNYSFIINIFCSSNFVLYSGTSDCLNLLPYFPPVRLLDWFYFFGAYSFFYFSFVNVVIGFRGC